MPTFAELRQGTAYETGGCLVVPGLHSGLAKVDCYGPDDEPAEGERPSVRAVALQAVEQLGLPSPAIRMNPSTEGVQMVGVPTWLWVDRSVWRPAVETAQVPGVSVQAIARPRKVVWSIGEGGQVECQGPGTPYSPAFSPESASPDCSYTYRRSSVDQPNGIYTVSAAITWDVVWEGAGQSGRVPGMVTVDEVDVVVDEIQALVVNSR